MSKKIFKEIPLGQSIPINNIHAVSVSMPKLQHVIDYEEQTPQIVEQIVTAYPRFILHPYLKQMALYIKKKYKVSDDFEVVVVSSQKAVKIIADKYFIHNSINVDENFGIILVLKNTCQLQKVLKFIQHVGCNLSSRFAQDYLYDLGLLKNKHEEVLYPDENKAQDVLLNNIEAAYKQKKENLCLSPSGMNSIYSALKGIKSIGAKNGRTILVQLGWLYLDTMNVVKNHHNESKIFYDIKKLSLLEEYLKSHGLQVSAIVTELPTNPLLLSVDIIALSALCKKYNIPLIVDATFATPYNIDLKPYADIMIESLTKYACGNADVLMGVLILNENSTLSFCKEEFFKHCDKPYIKDIQRLAYQSSFYEQRMQKINANTIKLIKYLEKAPFVDELFHTLKEENYVKVMAHKEAVGGIISLTFNKSFQKVYDLLNFPKGPSLGTEFTLLMPYVYLAHYDFITCEKGRNFLKQNNIPIDLIRIAVGIEDIEDIIEEFERIKEL